MLSDYFTFIIHSSFFWHDLPMAGWLKERIPNRWEVTRDANTYSFILTHHRLLEHFVGSKCFVTFIKMWCKKCCLLRYSCLQCFPTNRSVTEWNKGKYNHILLFITILSWKYPMVLIKMWLTNAVFWVIHDFLTICLYTEQWKGSEIR